ncbi:MAG: hypothetical protein V5789_11240 [Colwellia sp.]
MNKLALLAFALLLFLSTLLWYLANGSLNDYLKSQVILQSHYYSEQQAQLKSANFSMDTGITQFNHFSLGNISGLTQPYVLTVDTISVQLAKIPSRPLNSPSISKKTTTVVNVELLHLGHLTAWSEVTPRGSSNVVELFNRIKIKLATDYPALYPQVSAKLYAQKYPERSEELALAARDNKLRPEIKAETNQAIIASKKAKQKKRLLGKALTRVKINNVIIEQLTFIILKDGETLTKVFNNISLGSFGEGEGLDSNQLGGEILKQLLHKLVELESVTNQ